MDQLNWDYYNSQNMWTKFSFSLTKYVDQLE
jgi:hypothetical protein